MSSGAVSRERRGGRRVRFTGGRLDYHDDDTDLPVVAWEFPAGPRDVLAGFTMTDVVTVPSHRDVAEVRTLMSVAAARELAAPAGERSPETFTVDVVVHSGGQRRRITATGRDIYAVTAPLAVEAVERILTGRIRRTGVASAGTMFDARDFLGALAYTLRYS